VSVTHLGFDPLHPCSPANPRETSRFEYSGRCPYLLYVGSRANYKNFRDCSMPLRPRHRCGQIFSFFVSRRRTLRRRAHRNIKAGIAGRVNMGRVRCCADCLLCPRIAIRLPVLLRGFGIPVLEAMSLDCPVACSNSSSLPEVVGDAAKLFDPRDRDSIRSALESVWNHRRQQLHSRSGSNPQTVVFMAKLRRKHDKHLSPGTGF